MKLLYKYIKWILIFIMLLIWTLFFYAILKCILPIDLSQNYQNVQGIENIVFVSNWKNQCYKRCFWGLKKIEDSQMNFADKDISRESDDSISELSSLIETDNEIYQSIYSPDKKYILYCEIEYNYYKSEVTDDEYCYYRVYEIETDTIVTIYRAYRKWYNLLWIDETSQQLIL